MSQTLQQPQQQPQGGMQRIPFPTESYEHPSPPLSAKRLLNCFAEQAPADARNRFALRTVPGLNFREQLGVGPFRAFNTEFVGGFHAVSGSYAWRDQNGITTNIGYVGEPTDPTWAPPQTISVTIAVSPDYAMICVPPRLYAIAHSSFTMTPVDTSAFFGGGCNSIAYVDGYWVGTQAGNGNKFFVSAPRDPFTWDPLDYASADAITNILRKGIRHRGELWLLGAAAIEVWYNSGAADFPFRRQSGGVIPYGVAPRSVAQLSESVWLVSYDGRVYRSNGYKLVPISTHAIEAIIESGNPDYIIGMAYIQEGHAYYCITLTDLGRTLVYDGTTQQWHDRSSGAGGVGAWRPLVTDRIGEGAYAGDAQGRLYVIDPDGTTDNGELIYQSVTMPPLYATTRRAFCARAEMEMEAPPSTDVLLSWSDDGGRTFNASRTMSGGQAPIDRRRLVSTRLGSFRQRTFRVETRGRVTLYAMDAEIVAGNH